MLLCFRVANALATWRQAQVCLRPLLITAKQSLPAAFHSSTGSPYELQLTLLHGICSASA